MESRVSSRLSAKRYETTLNEVFDEDVNFKTQLYKVDIFGHNLNIAPGKVIYDTDIEDLVYCFVYAVQDDKPVMKLGVYERIEESKDLEVFDLTEFKEGAMLLFEYYETNPTKIAELETSTVASAKDENAFDLIRDNVFNQVSDIYKFYESKSSEAVKYTKDAFNHAFELYKKMDKNSPVGKILKIILTKTRDSFGVDKVFNIHSIENMKAYCENKYDERFNVCLAVLSNFLKVKFIVMNSDGNIYNDVLNLTEILPAFKEPTHYVVLRNYELYYQDKIQPYGSTVSNDEPDSKIFIQIYKVDEVPTYLKNELQNVSAENAMIAEQAEENPEEVKATKVKSVDLDEQTPEAPPISLDTTPEAKAPETKALETKPTKIKLSKKPATIKVKTPAVTE